MSLLIALSAIRLSITCTYAQHFQLFCFLICQNAFFLGRGFRTNSLNTHFIVLFRNNRDLLQIEILGRQIFGKQQVKYLIDNFQKATSQKYRCLHVDLSPHSDPTYTQTKKKRQIFVTVSFDPVKMLQQK